MIAWVIDDSALHRRLISEHLERAGFDVVKLSDGEEAFKKIVATNTPAIAIIDWQMPGMNGVQLCRKLKKTENLAFTYTLMVTSKDGKDDMLVALEGGADDYLSKPVDPRELLARVKVAQRLVEAMPPPTQVHPHIPGYKITGMLGRGSMGSVWSGIHLSSGKPVAIKTIRKDLAPVSAIDRFVREAKLTMKISHPNVAHVIEQGIEGAWCWYAMPKVEGRDLGKYVREDHPDLIERLDIMIKVCEGLEQAHQNKIVHRDLKPQNILVNTEGEPVLVDFGLAKNLTPDVDAAGASLTQEGIAVGSPRFMSPEQARGENNRIDARSDVYGLGVLTYILACERFPVDMPNSSVREVLRTVAWTNARPLREVMPEIDLELDQVILTALAYEQKKRYPSAGVFGQKLKEVRNRLVNEQQKQQQESGT